LAGAETLLDDCRGICLCCGKFSGESEFGKDLRYRSEHAIQILLFTFFWPVDFLFGKDPKDVTACFENFLVPQESLMSWNIIFKSCNDSLMFQIPFLIMIPYSS
jgi:hypothetical protein